VKSTIKNINRPHWSGLEERSKKVNQGYLRLDRNENLDEIYKFQLDRICRTHIDYSKVMSYEDYFDYYNMFSLFYNIPTDSMLITGGCDEAIRLAFESSLEPGKKYLYISPTYRGANTNAIDLGPHMLTCDEDEESIEVTIKDWQPDVFYICSPNNPSGKTYEFKFIENLLKSNPDTLIFIDNTYCDFTDISYHSLIKYKNCLIGKSYSKGWGLAGSRIGLLLGHPETINEITKIRPIMSVSSFSLQLIYVLMNNNHIILDTIQRNREGISWAHKYFNNTKVYTDPYINHIIFDADKDLIQLLDSTQVLYPRMVDYGENAIKLTTMPIKQFEGLICSNIYR
jgi:histidinol-phosphate aminotransferase